VKCYNVVASVAKALNWIVNFELCV